MVGDQTTNQAANSLKKGKKNSPVLEQQNCSPSSCAATPLGSKPVCVCLLGRLGAGPPVVGGRWVGSHGPTGGDLSK
jgi:hypothetical protein